MTLRRGAELQQLLRSDQFGDINIAFNYIQKNGYLKEEPKIYQIVHEIFQIASIRPSQLSVYGDLLGLLFEKAPTQNVQDLLYRFTWKEFTQSPISDVVRFKIRVFKIIRQLYEKGHLKIVDILDTIIDYLEFPNHLVAAFLTFLPEMTDPHYTYLLDTIKTLHDYDPYLQMMVENLDKLKENNYQLIKEYINYGCPKNTIEYAVKYDDLELLKTFKFDKNMKVTMNPFYQSYFDEATMPLAQAAALFASVNVLQYLIEIGAPLQLPMTKDTVCFAECAVVSNNDFILKLANDRRYRLPTDTLVPIIFRRPEAMATLLTDKKNDVELLSYECIDYDSIECFLICVEHGAPKISEYGLMRATKFGNRSFMEFYLENNTPVTYSDENGNLIHFAARGGHSGLIRLLYNYGCHDIDAKNSEGDTPLLIAMFHKFLGAAKTLQKYGASLFAKNNNNQSAIHMAAISGYPDGIRWLIKYGVDPTAIDLFGDTALHRAAAGKHSITTELLCSLPGVNINARNNAGIPPILLAFQQHAFHVVEVYVKQAALNEIDRAVFSKALSEKIIGIGILNIILDMYDNPNSHEIASEVFSLAAASIRLFVVNEDEKIAKKVIEYILKALQNNSIIDDALRFLINLCDAQKEYKQKQNLNQVSDEIALTLFPMLENIISENKSEQTVNLALTAIEDFADIVGTPISEHLTKIATKLDSRIFIQIVRIIGKVDWRTCRDFIPKVLKYCQTAEDLRALTDMLFYIAEEPPELDDLGEIEDESCAALISVIRGLDECIDGEEPCHYEDVSSFITGKLRRMPVDEGFGQAVCEFALSMKSAGISLAPIFEHIYRLTMQSCKGPGETEVLLQCWSTIGDVDPSAVSSAVADPSLTVEVLTALSMGDGKVAEHAFASACVTVMSCKGEISTDRVSNLIDVFTSRPNLLLEDPVVFASDLILDVGRTAESATENFLEYVYGKSLPLERAPILPVLITSVGDALSVVGDEEVRSSFCNNYYELLKKAAEIHPRISSKEDSDFAFGLLQSIAFGYGVLGEICFPDGLGVSGKQFLQSVAAFHGVVLDYHSIPLECLAEIIDTMDILARRSRRSENVVLNKAQNIRVIELCRKRPELAEVAKSVLSLIRAA